MKRIYLFAAMCFAAMSSFAQAPWLYYDEADGEKGADLKTALYNIIADHEKRSYSDLWTDFKSTDMRLDGKVWDMYSNTTNFIFGKENGGNQDTGSGGNAEGQYYNREHSFPNSWFGGDKNHAAYTDLFHLYPTDKYVNNKRGNSPFGETANPSWTSNNAFSKIGPCSVSGFSGTVFEPADEYKGDFARTYFYMATAYENEFASWADITADGGAMMSGNKYPGYKTWVINMLLSWSELDPVSEKEINRNNAVYNIQKNRNPFIDYPGLEEYIWGSCKDVAFSADNYVTPDQIVGLAAPIEEVNATVIYDLSGRRVFTTTPGLYIVNGRKVYMK